MANARQHYPPDKVETTPSGVRIEFYDKRTKAEHGQGQRRHYLIYAPGEDDPVQPLSVTTVLDVIEKPALKSWAQRIGIEGCIALAREGKLPQDAAKAMDELRIRDLCWWQVRDKRADEGTIAHEELVRLMAGGKPKPPSEYPPKSYGYVRGVCGFVADFRPAVIAQEQMVASPIHGLSGRLDLRASLELPNPSLLSGVGLFDLKTIETLYDHAGKLKKPYDENQLQLGAYEGLSIESGFPPTDFRAVVRVDSEGNYDVACTDATLDHFLPWLDGYRSRQALHAGEPYVRPYIEVVA